MSEDYIRQCLLQAAKMLASPAPFPERIGDASAVIGRLERYRLSVPNRAVPLVESIWKRLPTLEKMTEDDQAEIAVDIIQALALASGR